MTFKEGVRVFGGRPEIIWAVITAGQVYREMDNYKNFVVTSMRDGTHKRGSDHYVGNAVDLRVWGFSDNERAKARDRISERLTDEYEVFDEGDHIHIGFDVQNL